MNILNKNLTNIIFIPNYILLIFISLCILSNSIFSLNESILIYFYLLVLIAAICINYRIRFFKLFIDFKKIIIGILILLPPTIFIFIRNNIGISFRGDEIAHFSNSITNLSYWFTPQNYNGGLTKFYSGNSITLENIINIKIVNLISIILINTLIFFTKKKFFNLSIIFSSFILIYYQNSFPYEYSQGSFFIDNVVQLLIITINGNSISESLGITNYLFFIIYLYCLRPLIVGSQLKFNDIFIFSFLVFFPYSNLLLFSNYSETIGLIFVLLSIENIYKNNDLYKSIILFSIAGCFREIYFLPIISIFLFQIIFHRKNVIKDLLFSFIFFSPFFFHIKHIANNYLGQEKLSFIMSNENFFSIIQYKQYIFNLKLLLLIFLLLFTLFFFLKTKDKKYLLLASLNIPLILILFIRHNLNFIEIDRFYYLWVLVFYIFLLFELSKFNLKLNFSIMFLVIFYLNFYNFIDNYRLYKFVNSTNIFIPLKNNIKNNSNLYFYSDIAINRFTKNIYKGLNSVNFLNNFNFCDCSKNKSYFLVIKNNNNDLKKCNFLEPYNCTFKSNFYSLYTIRFN